MSEEVGPVYHEHHTEHPFLGQQLATDGGVSDATIHAIENEARRILGYALERAKERISQHRETLDKLVDVLLEQESIEGTALHALLGEPDMPRPSPHVADGAHQTTH
jgi:cell division protease FtsH